MNISLMKLVDSTFGRIIASILWSPTARGITTPIATILLIRPGGIGDAVLLAPAFRQIKKTYPDCHITVIAEKRNVGVFALVPDVDDLLCYDRTHELLQALRGRYDVVIDTEQWHRLSAVVARLVRAPIQIGFNTNERRRMFSHPIPYSHDDYEAASFRRLLVPLGIDEEPVDLRTPYLTVPVSASEKVDGLMAPLDGKPFVVIFPGASIPVRRWGAVRYSAVAKRLRENGYRIAVVGGREDRAEGEGIAGAGGLNLAGLTSLAESAAVITRSRLVISGDSGVLHVAVGLGAPTVSLFGPGIAAKWAPRGKKHIVINRNLPCSPCTRFGTTPPCPHDARCMKEITVDQVVEAAVRLLKKIC